MFREVARVKTMSSQFKSKPKPKHRCLSFNVNSNIRFKLTATGLKIHRLNWDKLNTRCEGNLTEILGPYQPPKVDSEGYTTEQMWSVMKDYGEFLWNGCEPPFDLTFQIESSDLTPVSRAKRKVKGKNQRFPSLWEALG